VLRDVSAEGEAAEGDEVSDFTKLNRFERVAALNGASAKARAIWAMAHNALDRRGRMELGGAEWKSVLCRRLGIDTAERQWFHAGLRELERRGLVSVANDVFLLHGHAGASRDLPPTSPGPSSDLPSTSSRPTPNLPPTCSEPVPDLLPGSTGNDSKDAPRARVENREEESRKEEKREEGDSDAAEPLSLTPSRPPKAKSDPVETEAECDALAAGLPPPLVAKCRSDLVSKSGSKLTPLGWRNALRELREAAARHGDDANQAIADSMQTYCAKYAGERPVAYLVGIVRGWTSTQPGKASRSSGMRAPSPDSHFRPEGDSDEYFNSLFPEVANA
jgi:hypothetical protein